jgi:Tol biopolymer transport system component
LLYDDDQGKIPTSWSPDGKFLLYQDPGHSWVLPFEASSGRGAALKPFPWLATSYIASSPRFSPDRNWVTYGSLDSGSNGEVYVAQFPGLGGKRQISTNGGSNPRWRADGQEIFYVGVNRTLMAAEVSIKGPTVEVGAVRSLGIPVLIPFRYDVSADGQHFLVAVPREQKVPAPLTLVQNWTALLKKK